MSGFLKGTIDVRGAREHNLKNVNVSIQKNKLTVITGLSGSGKSSLAFDTVYAEGQRRFLDSLSTYARNFLIQLNKPDVDHISGLSPCIAIDQKTVGHSPRSTVGTLTEVYDFLRLLFARMGRPFCPEHKIPVSGRRVEEIHGDISKQFLDKKIIVLAPVARSQKGEFKKEVESWLSQGYVSAKVDGQWVYLDQMEGLKKNLRHDIDIVVDKMTLKKVEKTHSRLSSALKLALSMSSGKVLIESSDGFSQNYSTTLSCPKCGFSYSDVDHLLFSFNSPKGACSHCNGLGTQDISEYEVTDYSSGTGSVVYKDWKLKSKNADFDWKNTRACRFCKGSGLKKEALNIYFEGCNIYDLSSLSIKDLYTFFTSLKVESQIYDQIFPEIKSRLEYLNKVGVGYLSLSRRSKTLSGGEVQRIRLASQVATPLVGVIYILDEPSIGLHPRDHQNVLDVLKEIKNRGNTIIVVEHDENTIRQADFIIDVGPGAGRQGGRIVYNGSLKKLHRSKGLTGQYISGKKRILVPKKREISQNVLKIKGACGNNLKNIDVEFPLGALIGVTGVSGSGKSTLVIDTLYKNLANRFLKRSFIGGPLKKIDGVSQIDNIVQIDQKPIGRTPRSCPATYVGLFPMIRTLFSNLPDSKIRGYSMGRFSFNVSGGRCENCQGAGIMNVRMQFLSDVYVPCPVCQGQRYNPETLFIKYRDKSIYDVLCMTVEQAHDFFSNHRLIQNKIESLLKVGLHYMTLGQSSTTLSGGEAQRIKLSRELSKKFKGHNLYILDEPTTGLHTHDVAQLIQLLQELVHQGHTVIVVEHNLDVIKSCDYLVDLGPQGGQQGGELVFSGPTHGIVNVKESLTGKFLRGVVDTGK